jgi:hypothetical protein
MFIPQVIHAQALRSYMFPVSYSNHFLPSMWLHVEDRYTLINQRFLPAVKTMVVPHYIGLFHIHKASALKPYNSITVNSSCMVLVRNLELFWYGPGEWP